MGDVQKPQTGIGGDFREGIDPRPGGTIDTGDSLIPPYEGRSSGTDENESTRERTASVERMLENTASKGEAEIGKVKGGDGAENVNPSTGEAGTPISADEVSHSSAPADPHGVGDSDSRSGESLEPPATEHKGATNRPVGQVEGDLMEPNNSGSGTSDID